MNCVVNESVRENCLCACSEGIAAVIVNRGTRWRHVVGFKSQEVEWV